ncbi:dTDP-4-dehydrorhamnose 3,5-epimerase [Clostridioides sp. ZZV14-6045]|uniref:dTDP-4-dehydrorhamnose 3,5-epimerase n=1 Tax=Clostridioides sp. ZZV14-6045 TaxID=2811489 RepID=UPI001D112E85|nr:dTDP-4-dehydrorhamnose 3,5-epimerase [Clostridioides sp. ZZV14-6045]
MKVTDLGLEGVKLIEPIVHEDFRGYYMESYSLRSFWDVGIKTTFVQDNHLLSLKKGTIRGIHFQNMPKAQAKLVRCTKGKIMDFAIDLRKSSPTYKKWISVELSADNKKQIFIPKGFGHACISLVDDTEIQYKVDELYHPELDRAILWNDPEFNIDWGMESIIVSEKDKNAPYLKNSDVNFVYGECRYE